MCVKEQFEEQKNKKKKHLETSQKITTVKMCVEEQFEEQRKARRKSIQILVRK